MAERRILIEADGDVRLPVVPDPLLSSGATTWEGFLLEQHYMPPVLEFPAHMRFPGHIIAVTLCDEPPTTYWRENGRERNARLFNGRIAMTSQEIYASHQIGASIAQALLIHDSTMERVCEELPGQRTIELVQRPDVEDHALRFLIMALVEDLKNGCPTGRTFGESIVNTIAAYSAQRYARRSIRFREHRDGLSALCLRRVLEYIEANLAHDLGVNEISQVALISPYYFGKLFKQSTGQTLHRYVLERRIRKAKNLLATSNLALVEIASSVGLPNQSHFTTAFRKKMGVTPGYFRATVKGISR
jgi:AraC family transcriptional regulator